MCNYFTGVLEFSARAMLLVLQKDSFRNARAMLSEGESYALAG